MRGRRARRRMSCGRRRQHLRASISDVPPAAHHVGGEPAHSRRGEVRDGRFGWRAVHVNNVRTAVGMPALAAPTFQDVMYEKYIAMFQNIDVWSDFRRRCLPLVKPYLTRAEVLGRLPYGSAERTSNANVPLPAAYPAKTTGAGQVRNWNDPAACPRP